MCFRFRSSRKNGKIGTGIIKIRAGSFCRKFRSSLRPSVPEKIHRQVDMSRALLQDGGGDAPAPGGAPVLFGEQEILDAVTWGSGAFNPFQTPAVMVADWLGFVIVRGSPQITA